MKGLGLTIKKRVAAFFFASYGVVFFPLAATITLVIFLLFQKNFLRWIFNRALLSPSRTLL